MLKKKWLIRGIILFMILAAVFGAAAYIDRAYHVEDVQVEGNVHYTAEEIKNIVMSGHFGDNSLYLSWKYRNRDIKGVPFVDVMEVEIAEPHVIRIHVKEKKLTGYVKCMDTFIYFDKDGYAVESSGVKTAGIPQVLGLSFDSVVLGKPLPVEDADIFRSILTVTKMLQQYNIEMDKILFGESQEISLYRNDFRVDLGNDVSTLEKKMMLLPELLPNLEGQKGVLQMKEYNDRGDYIFKPE